MRRILANRTVRKCVAVGCLAIEPCIHIVGIVTGYHMPHPEGIGAMAMNYLTVD